MITDDNTAANLFDKKQSRMNCLLEAVETVTSDLQGKQTNHLSARYDISNYPLSTAHDYPISKSRIPAIRNYVPANDYMPRDAYSLDRAYFNDMGPATSFTHERSGSINNCSLYPADPPFEVKKRKPKVKAPTFPELVSSYR